MQAPEAELPRDGVDKEKEDTTMTKEGSFEDLPTPVTPLERIQNKFDIDEDEEDLLEVELEEDVFSILFIKGFTRPSSFPVLIIAMQIFTIFLFFWDLLGTKGDYVNAPTEVSLTVRIAQFMALPLTVMCHEDCTIAIHLLIVRYDPQIMKEHPNATKSAWWLSVISRLVVGSLLVIASFVEIMQATRVTDMFLSLEAIRFVGEFDNFGFWLVKRGYLTEGLQEAAEECEKVRLIAASSNSLRVEFLSRRWRNTLWSNKLLFSTVLLITLYVLLIAGWAVVGIRQEMGSYLEEDACGSFSVRFGDDVLYLNSSRIDVSGTIRSGYSPNLNPTALLYSAFSGNYVLQRNMAEVRKYHRFEYQEDILASASGNNKDKGRFKYCKEASAWIFTIDSFANAFTRNTDGEDCPGWLLRSPTTTAYKLEDVPTAGWRIWTGDVQDGEVSVPSFLSISCDDCQASVDCNYHGTCASNSTCVCDQQFLGPNCEISPPCASLEVEWLGASSYDYQLIGPFQLLQNDQGLASAGEKVASENILLVYNRPVYIWLYNVTTNPATIRNVNEASPTDVWYALFYGGSRWLVTWNLNTTALQSLFFNRSYPVHSFWDDVYSYDTSEFSEITDSGTPIGISAWNQVSLSGSTGDYGPFKASYPFQLAFHCIQNSCAGLDNNYCGQYGYCQGGECVCNGCYGGYFCEFGWNEPYVVNEYYSKDTSSSYYRTQFLANKTCI